MADSIGYYRYDRIEDVPVHDKQFSGERLGPDDTPGYGKFGNDTVPKMTSERPSPDDFPAAAEPLESEEA